MSDRIITSGTIAHGSLGSIGATALQLSATSIPLVRGITIRADDGNSTNFVFVGDSTVTAGISAPTTDGYKLKAGESITFAVSDVSKVWIVGSSTGLAVSWIGN